LLGSLPVSLVGIQSLFLLVRLVLVGLLFHTHRVAGLLLGHHRFLSLLYLVFFDLSLVRLHVILALLTILLHLDLLQADFLLLLHHFFLLFLVLELSEC
jgi:hypothetical protein